MSIGSWIDDKLNRAKRAVDVLTDAAPATKVVTPTEWVARSDDEDLAFHRGKRDRALGFSTNPFPDGTNQARFWQDGYNTGDKR